MARCGCTGKCNCLVIAGSNITVTGSGSLDNPFVVAGLAPYTDEMARDALGAALVAGTGISIVVDDPGNTITITNTTSPGDSDEQVRDVIGAALVAGTGISIVVDDPGDTITVSSTVTAYTDEQARDAIGAALVAGSGISIAVDDPGNTITIASTGLDATAEHFKGAWSSGTTYVTNDVVTDAYSLFIATSPSTNSDPVIQALATSLGTTGAGSSIASPNAYQAFTPSATVTVGSVTLTTLATTNSGGFKVGIASAPGTSGATSTYLTQSALVSNPADGVGTSVTATFTPVTLNAGTTYYLVLSCTSGDPFGATYVRTTTDPATLTGLTSVGSIFGANQGAGWGGSPDTTHTILFRALGASPIWQKISNTGNQENVGQVPASGAAVTIADPELQPVTRIVLTANCTITLPPIVAGKSFTVSVVQDATGGRTVTWAGSPAILWPGGVAPTQTATALKGDVYTFMADGSANWIGFVAGQNY